MTLDELLEKFDAPDASNESIASDMTGELIRWRKSDLAEAVLPLLRSFVINRRRREVRRIENRQTTTDDTSRSIADILGDRQAVLVERVNCGPEYGYITWGDMTADHHEARAAMQRRLADTVNVDAARHEKAAELLRAHKVNTLNDKPSLTSLIFGG